MLKELEATFVVACAATTAAIYPYPLKVTSKVRFALAVIGTGSLALFSPLSRTRARMDAAKFCYETRKLGLEVYAPFGGLQREKDGSYSYFYALFHKRGFGQPQHPLYSDDATYKSINPRRFVVTYGMII